MFWKFVKSPWLHLFSGLILFVTSGIEVWRTIGEDTVGAHHGLVVFSIVQIVKAIPEFHEAADHLSEKLGGESRET